jgi:hypothetical protein
MPGKSEGQAAERPGRDPPPPDPLGDMSARVSQLVDYFVYYVSTRIDILKFGIKKRIFIGSWIAIGVLASAGAIITAVVLLCDGICDGLTVLLGHRWAGELLTAVLLLGGVAIVGFGIVGQLIKRSNLKTMAKYEALRHKQPPANGKHTTSADRPGHGDPHG